MHDNRARPARLSRCARAPDSGVIWVEYQWSPTIGNRHYTRVARVLSSLGYRVDCEIGRGSVTECWRLRVPRGKTICDVRRILASRGITHGIYTGRRAHVFHNAVDMAGRTPAQVYREHRAACDAQLYSAGQMMRAEAQQALAMHLVDSGADTIALGRIAHKVNNRHMPSGRDVQLIRLLRLRHKLIVRGAHPAMMDLATSVHKRLTEQINTMLSSM